MMKSYSCKGRQEIELIEYYFQDWFDGAKRELTGDEFEAVAEVFGYLADV